jgi:putative acetyltransferase
MTAARNTAFALRPYLAADTPLLAAIFRLAVEELTGDDYNEAQQQAWAAAIGEDDEFAQRLAQRLTLIATLNGQPVGFCALEGKEHIDLVYVHPAVAGQGVGSMLCDALEKLAAARGAAKLTVDASDNARAFFEHRGYQPQRRNTVMLGDEWLANTTMEKRFAEKGPTS